MHGHTDWFGDTADVRVWDDQFFHTDLDALVQHIQSCGFHYGWKSADKVDFGHWNHTFAGRDKKSRQPVECYIDPICSPIVSRLKTFMPTTARIIRCYANGYTFGTEGYPHVDSDNPDDITAMVYLNREWKREWGGETVFFEGDEITKSVMPRYGRMVMFHSDVFHAARAVSRVCSSLRTVFVVKAKTNDS